MTDEKYFMQALKEYEKGEIDEALWIKSLALESGDKVTAKFRYIRERADKILEEEGKESSVEQQKGKEKKSRLIDKDAKSGNILESRAELVKAGAWERYFARLLDFSLTASIILIPAIIIFIKLVSDYSDSPSHKLLFVVITALIVFMIDSFVYLLFGNTLGKSLLGLKVVDGSGYELEVVDYFHRNIKVWTYGFAFGIPLLNLACWVREFFRVNKGMPASYDEKEGSEVLSKGSGLGKKIVFIVVLILVLMIGGFTDAVISYTLNS